MAPNEDRNSNSITKLRLECKDGFLHITGGAQTEIKLNKIFLGYLTIKDLRELSLVSKDIHEIAQEPISAIKRHIDYLAFPIRNENIEEQEKYLIEYGILELRENPRTLEDLRAEGIYDSPMAIYRNYHINKNKFLNQEMLAILNCTSLEESRISYLKERLSFFLFSTNRMTKSDNEFLYLKWSVLQEFEQDRLDFANINFPRHHFNYHFDINSLISMMPRVIEDPIFSTFELKIKFIENFSLFIVNQIEGSMKINGSITIEQNDNLMVSRHLLSLGILKNLASNRVAEVKEKIQAINDMHLELAQRIIKYMDENPANRERQLDWIKQARQFENDNNINHPHIKAQQFESDDNINNSHIHIILNLYTQSIHMYEGGYHDDNAESKLQDKKQLAMEIIVNKINQADLPFFRRFSDALLKTKPDLFSFIPKIETKLEKLEKLETKIKDKILELETKNEGLDEWEILFERQELEEELEKILQEEKNLFGIKQWIIDTSFYQIQTIYNYKKPNYQPNQTRPELNNTEDMEEKLRTRVIEDKTSKRRL
ncbi:MAG: hypothetical protein WC755_06725 [Candidatus Woesearchaeota archaeon]